MLMYTRGRWQNKFSLLLTTHSLARNLKSCDQKKRLPGSFKYVLGYVTKDFSLERSYRRLHNTAGGVPAKNLFSSPLCSLPSFFHTLSFYSTSRILSMHFCSKIQKQNPITNHRRHVQSTLSAKPPPLHPRFRKNCSLEYFVPGLIWLLRGDKSYIACTPLRIQLNKRFVSCTEQRRVSAVVTGP